MSVLTTLLKGSGDALPSNRLGKAGNIYFKIDCSSLSPDSGDVVKLMEFPADCYVKDMVVKVTTAEGATLTIDIGDYVVATDAATDADGYFDGLNGNSAAVSTLRAQLAEDTTAIAYAEGKVYTDETKYLGVLFNNDADSAVIEIWVLVEELTT